MLQTAPLNSTTNIVSFCPSTSPAACKREAPLDRKLSSEGGNVRIMEVQRGHICTPPQVTTVHLLVTTQLPRSKHSKDSSVTVVNTSNLMDTFHKSVTQGTGALPEKTGRESMTMTNAMINRQSRTLEDNVHNEDCDLLKSFIVSTQISQDLDKVDVVQASKMDAQEITVMVHDRLSARVAALHAKPETKKEIHLKANITEIPKSKIAELKQGPNCVTQTATAYPSKQTAAVLKTETKTVILAQTDSSKDSVQPKIPSETVRDTAEIAVTLEKASGTHLCRSKGPWVEISAQLTLVDKDIEAETAKTEGTSLVLGLDQCSALSDVFNSKQDKVTKDEDTRSGAPFSSSDSNGNLDSKTASTEILKEVELLMNKEKAVNGVHETKEVKVAPTVHHLMNLAGQEALLSTAESKKSTSLADSGMSLSLSDPEELSPRETDVFLSPTTTVACLSPDICPSSFKTEMLMSFTDQVFFPLDLEDHVRSPDLLLSPNDPAMSPSTNDSEKCLSPVETNRSLNPKGEEDEETCLTEAKASMRPAEKYIISTKEEGQSLSFSGEHAFPERDRNRSVTISVRDGDSLCFGSYEDNEVRSSGTGGLGFRASGRCSILAKKEEQLDYDTLYSKNIDGRTPRDSYKNTDSIADNTNVSGTVSSNAESVVTAGVQGQFRHGSREWMVYGGTLGHKNTLDSDTCLTSKWTKEGPLMATLPATSPQEISRFGRRGSGECMVYRGSLRSESSLDRSVSLLKEGSGQSLSVSTNSVTTNPSETWRYDKRDSGEWTAYRGSFQCKHSVDSGFRLFKTGSKESTAMDMLPATSQPGAGKFDTKGSGERMPMVTHLATSPPEIRRFVNTGRGEWRACGNSGSLPITDSKECLPLTTNLATSPPRTGRFGIRGSGEWRVYGGHTGRMCSLSGCNNLANAESKESLSVARQLATSPQVVPRAGRFGSGGSGEWRVYGGSTGCLSSAGGADRVNVNVSEGQTISPPSSYTYKRQRLSTAGSGERLSSCSVVRRSRSVGSSGRLSSSGSGGKLSCSPSSHRISSSGKFADTGSDKRKLIYSSASGRSSSVGSAGPSSGRRMTSIKTTPSPSGRTSVGVSGRWLSSSTNNGIRISSTESNLRKNDRISRQASRGFCSSSGSGRTNGTGGRVINSSDRPIRSTGSGASGNKERISVCKMAALSISAVGRERSQERRRPAQQPQQQQAAGENM